MLGLHEGAKEKGRGEQGRAHAAAQPGLVVISQLNVLFCGL